MMQADSHKQQDGDHEATLISVCHSWEGTDNNSDIYIYIYIHLYVYDIVISTMMKSKSGVQAKLERKKMSREGCWHFS